MTAPTLFVATCPTCGDLPGRRKFRDDAVGAGQQHQLAHTVRVFVFEPLDPRHACDVREVAR